VRGGRLLLVCAAVVVGCTHPRARTHISPDTAWAATFDSAQRLAADSEFEAADSVLAAYVRSEPTGVGAREATFWHALWLLDPANKKGSPGAAAQALNDYLADSGTPPHAAEALALRRLTIRMDSLSQTRQLDSMPAVHLVVSDDSTKSSAREQEMAKTVKQLQDSLNKTTAELDRIKKRLSTGKP
jgi:hypothetical protein